MKVLPTGLPPGYSESATLAPMMATWAVRWSSSGVK
jgi:hypothetical protein